MSIKVFVPRDSSALSLGAEKTAKAIAAEAAKRCAGDVAGLEANAEVGRRSDHWRFQRARPRPHRRK